MYLVFICLLLFVKGNFNLFSYVFFLMFISKVNSVIDELEIIEYNFILER